MTKRDSGVRVLAKFGQLQNKIREEAVLVTPEMAAEWLETSKLNRRISQQHVDRLAGQMKDDKWLLTHQAIAFDPHGRLIDGQHRLWAVILSAKSVWMMVAKNVQEKAAAVIDTGKNRALQDRLTVAGNWGRVSRTEGACLKRMLRGMRKTFVLSPTREQDCWKHHCDAIRFAIKAFPTKRRRLTNSVSFAVIARASYMLESDHLRSFCEKFVGNDDYFNEFRDIYISSSGDIQYASIERCIWQFVYANQPEQLGELFPIPEDRWE